MRALRLFGRPDSSGASLAAVRAATASHAQAVADHRQATAQREVADVLAEQVRGHNTANRYDEWLAAVMRGQR